MLERFRHHYAQDLVGNTLPYPGVPAMLGALRPHARLAVATNKPGLFARPLVDALLPGVFDVVVGGGDTPALKPDPSIVRAIEDRLGGTVCAFVGDSAVDVETARNARVPFVGVAWGLRPHELADAAVDVAELSRRLLVLVHETDGLPG